MVRKIRVCIAFKYSYLGSPFFDVARFLAFAFDAEIRREIQEHVVEEFYKMLEEEYKLQSGGRMKPNFTLEQVSRFGFAKF